MTLNLVGKSILVSVFWAAVGFALVGSVSVTASAKGKKVMKSRNVPGPAGCGLGYLVLGGKDMQILAVTLNATGYQTSGITSGTSGCDTGSRDSAMLEYIQMNKEVVQTDLARGQGESLEALANITGCSDQSSFATGLKERYQDIFPSKDPSAARITDSIKKVIEENPQLASSCPKLS